MVLKGDVKDVVFPLRAKRPPFLTLDFCKLCNIRYYPRELSYILEGIRTNQLSSLNGRTLKDWDEIYEKRLSK